MKKTIRGETTGFGLRLADRRMKTKNQKRKKMNRKKKLAVALACFLVFVSSVLGGLQLGVLYTDKMWKHWYPDYEKTDISPILAKEELTDGDYAVLYAQTGLTKIGIDGLRERGDLPRILKIQDYYFQKQTVSCDRFNPYTYLETVENEGIYAALEDGDIIVSATTHVSLWRLGHACLVVDGKYEVIAEALGPGTQSRLASASTFADLANFMVLRPKFDKEFRAEVAAYARENLIGAEYNFSIGILSKKYNKDKFERTQCAHLAWYAYRHFGIDLDSNGGLVVTPPEIANSPYVEIVQIFGFDPEELWKNY